MADGPETAREITVPDWGAVRTDYIQNELSLGQLSERYNLPRSTLGDKCKGEDWVGQRRKYLELVRSKADEAAARKKARKLEAGRDMATTNATVILMGVRRKLGLIDSGQIKLDNGQVINLPDLDVLELRRLALANSGAFESLCTALGVMAVENLDTLVELPDDPLADLATGIADEDGDDDASS